MKYIPISYNKPEVFPWQVLVWLFCSILLLECFYLECLYIDLYTHTVIRHQGSFRSNWALAKKQQSCKEWDKICLYCQNSEFQDTQSSKGKYREDWDCSHLPSYQSGVFTWAQEQHSQLSRGFQSSSDPSQQSFPWVGASETGLSSWLFCYSGSTSAGRYFIRIEQSHLPCLL